MKFVSGKLCRETQNFMLNNFNLENRDRTGQATNDNMARACCMLHS